MSGHEEIECRKLREAAEWLKKMEQRYAKQRKEVEARYHKLLPRIHKRLQRATSHR
jgi:chaperonin cofactor prefoldin